MSDDALTTWGVIDLYRAHAESLARARGAQRDLLRTRRGMKAQLDDIEAEITYLLIRRTRPRVVAEIGALHGWSTSWLLQALRDNDGGQLHSFDAGDRALEYVPGDLGAGRWTLHRGDVRAADLSWLRDVGALLVDADHGARFARWHLAEVLPRLPAGTPVAVHDVFHFRRAKPHSEGSTLLRWLYRRQVAYFTASRAREPRVFDRLAQVKRELGLDEPVRRGETNPMVFFRAPGRGQHAGDAATAAS